MEAITKICILFPEGETIVTHDTLGKDKINPELIYNKFKELLG